MFDPRLRHVLFSTGRVAGVMVSIAAFQAVDPGSIPGPRNFYFEENLTVANIAITIVFRNVQQNQHV